MPILIHEFDLSADLAGEDVGVGPFGHRLIGNVTGGDISGERLKGSITGAGADWLLIGADGYGRLDVRLTIRTVDGASVYFQYFGLLEVTPEVFAVMGGGGSPTEFADQYFFTNPRLETGDERYAWLNQTMFVAEGRVLPGPAVEYRIYRLANSPSVTR
jgi:hypothetical protein